MIERSCPGMRGFSRLHKLLTRLYVGLPGGATIGPGVYLLLCLPDVVFVMVLVLRWILSQTFRLDRS